MRSVSRAAAACVLLGGPTVLAFLTGGFRDEQRLVAAIAAWALVGLAALIAERPLPRSPSGRVALAGAALLAVWTTLSMAWAPLAGAALDDAQRALLYLGALTAAAAFLVPGRPARLLEPVVTAGATLVVCYGLSERLLPGLIQLDRSISAAARLEQPITYWNAMGAVAAIGVVAGTRIVADPSRPAWLRSAAAAAAAPLGAGVYLSFSRGAIVALAAGLLVLALLVPRRGQLAAIALTLATAALAAAAAGAFPWVRSLEDGGGRDGQGLAVLILLLAVAAAAALLARRAAAWEGGREAIRLGRAMLALGAAIVLVAGVLAAAATETRPRLGNPVTGATPARFGSVESGRYDYWRVGLAVFADHPLAGKGAAGFRVEWLQRRRVDEWVVDAHSLPIETAAELGIVGLVALGLLVGGTAAAGRRAYRAAPEAAAGAAAAAATWLTHALLDWDWEMPAVTLIAVCCAGVLIAAADRAPPVRPGARARIRGSWRRADRRHELRQPSPRAFGLLRAGGLENLGQAGPRLSVLRLPSSDASQEAGRLARPPGLYEDLGLTDLRLGAGGEPRGTLEHVPALRHGVTRLDDLGSRL